jgi:hypothetical protein
VVGGGGGQRRWLWRSFEMRTDACGTFPEPLCGEIYDKNECSMYEDCAFMDGWCYARPPGMNLLNGGTKKIGLK